MRARPIGLAAVAVIVAVAAWWLLREGSAPAPHAPPPPDAATGAPTPPPARATDGAPTTTARAAAEPATAATLLQVTVERAGDGSPLAGLAVRARGDFRRADGDAADWPRTDGLGRVALAFAGHARLTALHVDAGPDTPPHVRVGVLALAPGAREDVRIAIGEGAVLAGLVVDPDDRPVAGAKVMAWLRRSGIERVDGALRTAPDREVLSDAHGGFEIAHTGGDFELEAEGPGQLWGLHRPAGSVGGRARVGGLRLVVAPTVEFTGRAVDGDGMPIADHPVGATRGGGTTSTGIAQVHLEEPVAVHTRTDGDGGFRLRAVADYPESWEVQHPDHPMFRVRHRPRDGHLAIVLDRGATLRGRVFLPSGSVAAGAEVIANDHPPHTARCAEDGTFAVRGVQLEQYHQPGQPRAVYLRIRHPEAAIHCVQPVTAAVDGDLLVNLGTPRPLAGTVRDADGTPVADAAVHIVGDRTVDPGFTFGGTPTWEWAHDVDEARTDGEGRFAFPNLYEGTFTVTVRPPDDPRLVAERSGVPSGTIDLVVQLDRQAMRRVVLRGRVVDDASGQPIASFRVVPMHWDGQSASGRHFDLRDDDGRFELVGLEPGRYQLTVSAPGHADFRSEARELALGEHWFDVRLAPCRDLVVRVRDTNGAPADATVRVQTLDGEPVWLQTSAHSRAMERRTEGGELALTELPVAPLRFHLRQPGGHADEHLVDLRSLAGDVVELTVGQDVPSRRIVLLFAEAPADGPPPRLADRAAWVAALREHRAAPVAADVSFTVRTGGGDAVAAGELQVLGRSEVEGMVMLRYASAWRTGDTSYSDPESEGPLMVLTLEVPGTAETVEASAEGYEAGRVTLRPPAAADETTVVWMRRRR